MKFTLKKLVSHKNKILYAFNSFLSVFSRFLLIFALSDYLNFKFEWVYIFTYFYVLFQSYLISKYIVFKSSKKSYFRFLIFNLGVTFFEYFIIVYIKDLFNIYYSAATLLVGFFTFFIRYIVYSNIIFKDGK